MKVRRKVNVQPVVGLMGIQVWFLALMTILLIALVIAGYLPAGHPTFH